MIMIVIEKTTLILQEKTKECQTTKDNRRDTAQAMRVASDLREINKEREEEAPIQYLR